jgi:cleavage and polyadenylation specificity factor subunit 1
MYAKGLDRDERLMGLAFLDINQYATSIKTFKNFALVGDLTKSMWLISFQVSVHRSCQASRIYAKMVDWASQGGRADDCRSTHTSY